MEATPTTKYAHYLRVSTTHQGRDGLGIDAQRTAVAKYTPAAEFIEVESGKKKNRPELLKALAYCKKEKAVLVVAKLDRLSRNVLFTATLMESGVEFIAADMPEANRMTIQIMAVMAEHEAKAISDRTKKSLAELKVRLANGGTTKSGKTERTITMDDTKRAKSAANRSAKANEDAAKVAATIKRAREAKATLQSIADELNGMNVPTPRGKLWTPAAVRNALERV
ncbi:recombinase family protein [Geomonas sp. Red32]|uniref:recombinase family protein n=1 Tax=Geomonas sp. Red32 TaxID=2912856 RepID=UPI00202D02F1|nr:recombinase family protein [Geomonas sp. Red32]MCM0082309.1 recombinase family protein [Geomonas sp. Red32]